MEIIRKNYLTGLLIALAFAVSACATSPKDVYDAADNDMQKAYALYGTFVVYEEQGAVLVQDPRVGSDVKKVIRDADRRVKPVMDKLLQSVMAYDAIRNDVEALEGDTDLDKVRDAATRLKVWLDLAIPAVKGLVEAVRGAF